MILLFFAATNDPAQFKNLYIESMQQFGKMLLCFILFILFHRNFMKFCSEILNCFVEKRY